LGRGSDSFLAEAFKISIPKVEETIQHRFEEALLSRNADQMMAGCGPH